MPTADRASSYRTIGRYTLFEEIASGGMATVHLARLVGPVGFSRTVAVKRMHAHLAKDPEFVAMFLDEARLVARIHHPNVVPTLDVVEEGDELLLVMEYVQGESLSKLLRQSRARSEHPTTDVVASIFAGVLHGLHAAHEATGERGEPLDIVHRDVTPQNILVGTDGVARLLDFGVAKAAQQSHSTRDGRLKGKLAYMAPEHISGEPIDRRCDIFSTGTALWEALAGRRLFEGETDARIIQKILTTEIRSPSEVAGRPSDALDSICARALAREPSGRFATARDMALALEHAAKLAPASEVGLWVERFAHGAIADRAARVKDLEGGADVVTKSAAELIPIHHAERTEVSAVPAHESPVAPPARGLSPGLTLLGGLILLAVAGGGGYAIANRRGSVVPASLAAQGGPSSPAAVVSAPPSQPPTTTPDTTLEPRTGQPTSTTADAAVGSASSAKHSATTKVDLAKSLPRSAPPTQAKPDTVPDRKRDTADCTTPFEIDSAGIKRVKPGCL